MVFYYIFSFFSENTVNVNKALKITRTYVNRFVKGQRDKGGKFDNARQKLEGSRGSKRDRWKMLCNQL